MSKGNAISEEKSHVIKMSIAARRMFRRNHGDNKNIIAIKRSKLKTNIYTMLKKMGVYLTTTRVHELKKTAVACRKLKKRQRNEPKIHR